MSWFYKIRIIHLARRETHGQPLMLTSRSNPVSSSRTYVSKVSVSILYHIDTIRTGTVKLETCSTPQANTNNYWQGCNSKAQNEDFVDQISIINICLVRYLLLLHELLVT